MVSRMHIRKSAIAGWSLLCILGLGLGLQSAVAASKLSSTERRIVAAAEAQNELAVQLLETLVNINSGTMNLEGVARVGEIMREQIASLGFEVRWVPMTAVGRAGHVVAKHAGSGRGKRLLLIGHLDTVFEKESPFQKFERRGSVAEGPGVNDMKDGLAIMMAALRAMQAAGTLKAADITIVLSGDEENAGRPHSVSRADMIEAASHSDLALEFEALVTENGRDMGSISRRSASMWSLRASARSGHSSDIFSAESGFGAAYELIRILDAFRLDLREPSATYNVGLILGGATADLNEKGTGGTATGKSNIIAATAYARGDLRTVANEQTDRMRKKMAEIVARHLPGTQAEITFEEGYPAMAPTEGNRALLARLNAVNEALGLERMNELDPLKRGAGDIAFITDRIDGLVGLGGVGKGSHAPGETVDLASFDRQIKRAALLMTRLSRERR